MIEPGTLTTVYARTGELFNALVILGLVVLGARRRRKTA
jgi:MYXO-CTERM domain-containing protein